MEPFITRYHVLGADLTITRQGRLIYTRGFGYADREAGLPVSPRALFRIANFSKTFTAVAGV